MKKINVHLSRNSYSVVVGPLSQKLNESLRKALCGRPTRILLVSSPRLVRAGHVKKVRGLLSGLAPVETCLIPDGERHKTVGAVLRLFRAALRAKLDRRSLVVVVGGGVLTDVAGFFAATYMRGVPYASVPTTLLGMVDAAIGGKTAVDLPEGKNLFGAFWQPVLVWNDPSLLSTLPVRQWKTGMAEVVKYGIIVDASFFAWLEKKVRRHPNPLHWSKTDLEKMIAVSAAAKARVVSADEKETPLKGGREILNFGHTIGHALEAATGYSRLTHGEAISIGMVSVGKMALKMGLWSEDAQLQLLTLLDALGLPLETPKLASRQWRIFWASLASDKKNVGGRLRFVLPVRIGRVLVKSGIPASLVRSALA